MNNFISVIMPAFRAKAHISEAVQSIQNQTYPNWELLVIQDLPDDGTTEIIRKAAANDPRIFLIQNQIKQGIAESLNLGMRLAKGQYIARMDADDLSHRQRFEKQVCFLDSHPNISLCGTWQHHFGRKREWIHKTAVSPERCRANLLFSCDLCHSTVMFRRKDFIDRNLFYKKQYLAEDFELWTRAVRELQFANLPEVLGEYRWDGENITARKMDRLAKEHAIIVAKALQTNLGITVPTEQKRLLEGWGNPFYAQKDRKIRRRMYRQLEELLRKIYRINQQNRFYEEQALLAALNAQWRYAKYKEPRNVVRDAECIDAIFQKNRYPDYGLLWREFQSRSVSVGDDVKRAVRYLTGWKSDG